VVLLLANVWKKGIVCVKQNSVRICCLSIKIYDNSIVSGLHAKAVSPSSCISTSEERKSNCKTKRCL
jgi:hypothetical protein